MRPQTRSTYAQITTYALNSSGSLAPLGSVWRLTATSACATNTSCAGTPDEVKTTISYAGANDAQPTSTSRGAGDGSLTATTSMTYDSTGNVLTKTDPLNNVTRFRYDAKRRVVGEVGPDPDGSGPLKNRATRTTYDAAGRVTLVETGTVASQSDADWAGFTALESVSTTYDALDRKIQENRNSGGYTHGVKQWSYDAAGRLQCTAVRLNFNAGLPASACTQGTLGIYGPDRITYLTYDDAGKLLKTTSGYGTSAQRDEETQSYGADGEVSTRTDARGDKTTYVYDGLDRVSQIQYPTLSNGAVSSTTDYEGYTYDGNDNVLTDRRRDGQNTINYTYDARDNKTVGANSATFSYDNLDRPMSANVPLIPFSFTYDALGRMISETTPMGAVTNTYDLVGQRTNLKWPDGFSVGYAYDAVGEVTLVLDSTLTGLTSYTYDDLGRRKTIGRANSASTYFYYDGNQRLSEISHTFADASYNLNLYYYYNSADQLTSMNSSNSRYDWTSAYYASRPYVSDSQNRYTTGGPASYQYDARGNLTSDGSRTYQYSVTNQLTGVSNGTTINYDALDRLFQTVQSTTTRFLYDGQQIIGEYDGNNALMVRYALGPDPGEVVVRYGPTNSDRRWLMADRMGSTIVNTDGSGAVVGINTYDEAGIQGPANIGRFQYDGAPYFSLMGLYHLQARDYSPTLGRFMQTDPILYQDGMSWYAYAHDDPVNQIDRNGTDANGDERVLKGKEHISGKRPSTEQKHQDGQARKGKDQGGEKGDDRRNIPKPKGEPSQPAKDSPGYRRPGPKAKPADAKPKPQNSEPHPFDPRPGGVPPILILPPLSPGLPPTLQPLPAPSIPEFIPFPAA